MNDLRVAAVAMQSEFGGIEPNLNKIERFVRSAAKQEAGIVCFPEMSITGYSLNERIKEFAESVPGPSALRVQQMADDHKVTVIAGLAELTEQGDAAIAQVVAIPGKGIEKYRKTHLSPGEQVVFRAGEKVSVFDTGGVRFGVQLCYDAHFPELSTMLALEGAEVLFMSHASPAPESAGEKRDRWLRYMAARAYDNSVFVVACNQVGDGIDGISFSGVILVLDPRGEVLAEAVGGEEKMLVASLDAEAIEKTRSTRMGFFLAHRRPDLYDGLSAPLEYGVV